MVSIWPSVILVILFSFTLLVTFANFGERKPVDRYDWGDVLVTLAIVLILYWGGFWDRLLR